MFKRLLAVVIAVGLLFSLMNLSVFAHNNEQDQTNLRTDINEILIKYDIDPTLYEDLDLTRGIPGLDINKYSNVEEYLFEFERRLSAKGPILLDKASDEYKNINNDAEKEEVVPENNIVKENHSQYIIKYKDSANTDMVKNHLQNKIESSKVIEKSTNSSGLNHKSARKNKIEVIQFSEDMAYDDLKQAIKNSNLSDYIEYIQPDYEISLSSYSIEDQWGMLNESDNSSNINIDINVIPAWALTDGEGVDVAVIDSGMDITHQNLINSIWLNTNEIPDNGIDDDGNGLIDDVNGWNFVNNNNILHNTADTSDEVHATSIAGIIASQNEINGGIVGVAPKAKIIPVKAFENGIAYTSQVIEAIQLRRQQADLYNRRFR